MDTIGPMSDSRLVYSTDVGDTRGKADTRHSVGGNTPRVPNDGVVRVFREKGGRGGKTVTVVRGLPVTDLTAVTSDLKRRCGSGGAVKDGAVEIQGDHREKIAARQRSAGRAASASFRAGGVWGAGVGVGVRVCVCVGVCDLRDHA